MNLTTSLSKYPGISGSRCRALHYLLILFLLILLCSCRQGGKLPDKTSSDEGVGAFQPNPERVDMQEVQTLKIGDSAPEFNLPDVHGTFYSLNDFNSYELLVIVFTCNHCPTAQAYEERLIDFTSDYSEKSVAVAAIMPNSAYGLLLEECGYSDLNDSYAEMKIRAEDMGFNFPYLYDGDNHAVSIKYGPVTTPHVFVFDQERKLRYSGRLDTSEKPGSANAEDLRLAVEEVLAGKAVTNDVTKTFGCSIKWAWKSDWTDKVNKDWDEKVVELEWISNDGIKMLLANDSENLRLINFWATWCAPCVTEFPEFVKLQRMYGNRDFEFISLSTDNPDNKVKVQKFLDKENAALQNYLYTEKDKYQLIDLVDTAWAGALPYTILIEPGGNIIMREQGLVDILELRKTIVEHPLLGRYY